MESDSPDLSNLANRAVLIFPVYAVLAISIQRDILDARWRPIRYLLRLFICYSLLYLFTAAILLAYIIIQLRADDLKEAASSILSLLLATFLTYRHLRPVRFVRVLLAHRTLVRILQRMDHALAALTGMPPVGLPYQIFSKTKSSYNTNQSITLTALKGEERHNYISSLLFDDEYPGPLISTHWILLFVKSTTEDINEAVERGLRVALWMRLVLRRPGSELWRLLTSSTPLIRSHLYHVSTVNALRSLVVHGARKPSLRHANINPAQLLLDKQDTGGLTDAGVAFFWIVSEIREAEIQQLVSKMPASWLRGVVQNDKQLIFELIMSLVLCDMPEPENPNMRLLLSLPVLEWRMEIATLQIWNAMAEVCANAVSSLAVPATFSHEEAYDIVRRGIFAMQDAVCNSVGFQGDIIGLSILEMIRASYRVGHLTETIVGPDLKAFTEHHSIEETPMHNCEIITSLYSILLNLGLANNNHAYQDHFQQLKFSRGATEESNDAIQVFHEAAMRGNCEEVLDDGKAASFHWFVVDHNCQCVNPALAFSSLKNMALELVPLVVYMLSRYLEEEGNHVETMT